MEKKMETTIMENQMEKNMANDLETGVIHGLYRFYMGTMEKTMTIIGIIGVL